MMYRVSLTEDAAFDLECLYDYIQVHDVPGRAEHLPSHLEQAFISLENNPQRGRIPKKLQAVGVGDYRELHLKPYRIIYKIVNMHVMVMLIVDGRRDLPSLLLRRLLHPGHR